MLKQYIVTIILVCYSFVMCLLALEDIENGYMCHHTYNANSPKNAGLGGCVDLYPSGKGGVVDQALIYYFAQQHQFKIIGGGIHTRKCFDITLLKRGPYTAEAIVLDNGHYKDISIPIYADLTGLKNIGNNCQNANARLNVREVGIKSNLASDYIQFIAEYLKTNFSLI